MKIKVTSKGILYDTIEITSTSQTANFFGDQKETTKDFRPVTSISESDISKWLLSEKSVKKLILDEINISHNSKTDTEVTKPFIQNVNSKPGDIDMLIFDSNIPTNAVAIECKRIRVKPETFYTGQIGGLKDAQKGVVQVNALAKNFTFSEVYLMLIIQVNGKERDSYNQSFRGITKSQKERIYTLPLRESIHPKVGLIFTEVIQVTNRPFHKNAYVGLSINKQPQKRAQSSELSTLLEKYFLNK